MYEAVEIKQYLVVMYEVVKINSFGGYVCGG